MHIKFFVLLYFLLISTGVFPAKVYIWLHDINEGKGSNICDIYQEHITNSNGYILEYSSNNGISNIAENLYNNKIRLIEDGNDIILIGYGMGGLIARSIQLLSPHVKGIITIGTVHAGSTLLKNTLNGEVYDYFSKAIRMVNAAIDKSLRTDVFSKPTVSIIAAPIVMPVTKFKVTVVERTLNNLKITYQAGIGVYALSHSCIRDMLPNSTYLKTLNAKPTNVPLLNIYGSEDYWQVVRAVGTLTNTAEVKSPKNIDKSFDIEFVTKMQSALGIIYQIQNAHNIVYNNLALPAIFMPSIWQERELVLNARYEWSAVYRYLETGMQADFAFNMGAVEYRLQNYRVPEKLAISQLNSTHKYLPYMLENDGFISRDDVITPLLSGMSVHNIRVVGVNYQEMGNHIEMRKLLEGIINSKTHGEIFAK